MLSLNNIINLEMKQEPLICLNNTLNGLKCQKSVLQKLRKNILHYPQLDTILMVEEFIRENSGEYKKKSLWEALPRKMIYQTFCVIFDYLLESGKIAQDSREANDYGAHKKGLADTPPIDNRARSYGNHNVGQLPRAQDKPHLTVGHTQVIQDRGNERGYRTGNQPESSIEKP